MKTRTIRVYLKTWKELRRRFPALKDETLADYLDRIMSITFRRIK